MNVPIPEPILARLEAFLATGQTGQFALNIFEGKVLTADVREHIAPSSKLSLDNVKKARYVNAKTE